MTAALNGLSAKLSAKGACNWDDVHLLRELLFADRKVHARSRSVASNTKVASRKIAAHSRTKSTAQAALSSHPKDAQTLTAQQRHKIATEVINYVLSVSNGGAAKQDGLPGAKPVPRNGSAALIQPSDPRKQANSRNETIANLAGDSRGIVAGSKSQDTQAATAELGVIAFEFLLSPDALDASTDAKSGHGHLIGASLVFSGKLLAWGQYELVEKQLRGLRAQLNPSIRSRTMRVPTSGLSDNLVSPQSLPSLLIFESINMKDLDRLGHISSFQSLVLRLIANHPSTTILEDALPSLDLSTKSCPINILLQCARGATLSKRVPIQLETLSKVLLYCSKKIIFELGQESQVASIVLRLQTLSLCSRIAWIAVSDHKGDSYREITIPFIQSAKEYMNNSADNSTQKFATVQSLARELDDFSNKHSRRSTPRVIHDNVLRLLLGYLACEAGRTDEGLETLDDVFSGDLRHVEEQDALYFMAAARLGRQSFAASSAPLNAMQPWVYLSSASGLLETGVTDGGIRFETLIRDAMQLRNAAYDHIRTMIASCHALDDQSQKQIFLCYDTTKNFLLFLLRNLSLQAKDHNKTASKLLERRLSILSRIVQQSIQAMINTTRQVSPMDWVSYDVMLSALQVIETIIRRLQALQAGSHSELFLGINIDILISELAKVHFQIVRSSDQSETQLQAGVNIIRNGLRLLKPISEGPRKEAQEAFGFLRLGRMQLKLSKAASALDSFKSSLKACVANGIVADAAQLAQSMPFSAVITLDANFQVLHSATRALLEIEINRELNREHDWIDSIQDANIRAVLLESRLAVFADWTQAQIRRSKAQCIIALTMQQLQDCYDDSEHPLRRRKVNADLLRFAIDSQTPVVGIHDGHPVDIISDLGNDTGLAHYNSHICATFNANSGLYRNTSGFTHIDHAIDIWLSLVNAADSWEDLVSQVYDVESWLVQLDSVADFLEMQGRDQQRIRCLALIARVFSMFPEKSPASRAARFLDVATGILDLGHPDAGKLWIDAATTVLDESHADDVSYKKRDLTMARWSLVKHDLPKCFTLIESLKRHLLHEHDNPPLAFSAQFGGSLSGKAQDILAHADIFYLYAIASLQNDQLVDSLTFTKRTVTLLSSIWRLLESKHGIEPNDADDSLAAVDALTRRLSRMSLTPRKAAASNTEIPMIPGPAFWPLTRRLFCALILLGKVSKHLGSFGSAAIACDQAQKIADAASAPLLRAQILAEKADLAWRSGNDDEAKDMYHEAEDLFTQHPGPTMAEASGQLSLADFLRHRRQWRNENDLYARLESTISSLESTTFLEEVSRLRPTNHIQTSQAVSNMSVGTRSTATALQIAPGRTKTKAVKTRPTKQLVSTTTKLHELATPTEVLRYEMYSRKIESMLAQRNLLASSKFLQKLQENPRPLGLPYTEVLLRATHLLHEALDSMAADAVFSMLPESTLSLPNVPISILSPSSVGLVAEKLANNCSQAERTSSQVLQTMQQDILDNLYSASKTMSTMKPEVDKWPNITIFRVQELMAACSMLLSFAGKPSSGYGLQPAQLASQLDLYKDIAVSRDYMVLETELENKAAGLSLEWPKVTESPVSLVELVSGDNDLTQMLPENWSVVSLNLREQDQHLYLTRYDANNAPFVLRLPLNRQTGDDLEEESFSLSDAREELIDIVQTSDTTVHKARDAPESMKVKGAKTQWWAERDDLDARLKSLLINMENIWFGGFRSMFSALGLNGKRLNKFRDTFGSILSRHLPSRQVNTKRAKSHPVALDDNVLGLFTGLMTSEEDGVADLDEALNDLLYFVVDILQYNGEANAYDEIDFDAIIVEVQDALLDYRDSLDDESASLAKSKQLILVLDKELHMFPWESMPCLERRSVSRMPSVRDIVDRIRLMQAQENVEARGVTVSAQNGTYMLNPGKDLPRTQTYFAQPLSTLTSSGWSGFVGRAPSEQEFSSALSKGIVDSDRGVMLYIGHGSGAQYIRAKTVRRLRPHCNAALLFGCSSVSLKEAGEFEAHGTPKNYLAAGAPAVLGSLWDVTDGDVDKFAGAVLEGWGLLPRGSCEGHAQQQQKGKEKTKGRGKSKPKTRPPEEGKRMTDQDGPWSLSDAVARSREYCYLRYLNGAAMVVYGVPVYLG